MMLNQIIIKKIKIHLFEIKRNNMLIIIGSLLFTSILILTYFVLINQESTENKIKDKHLKQLIEKNEGICETGDEEKCLICDLEKNECSKCNQGYKLVDGKCLLNYSFKATYFSNSANQTISLINSSYVSSIKEISVNNELIPINQNYTFSSTGNYTFYFLMNIPPTNSLNQMFKGIKNLTSISFTDKFNTENITDMSHMFDYCISLTSINFTNFNTKNVKNMEFLFSKCSALKLLDLSNFNTENVENMSFMFSFSSLLTSINLKSFNTKNVITMNSMFHSCYRLTSIDLSNFNTENVKDMSSMFYGVEIEKLDLSSFNTRNVVYMNEMF